jgi:tetratricopeptide (TPR) repeat protein
MESSDLTTAAHGEGSNSRVALGVASARFESSEGRNVQQGSGNTMIVHNNYLCNTDLLRGGSFAVILVSVLIAGYYYSEATVTSELLPSVAPGFVGREDDVKYILKKISYADAPSVMNIVGAPGSGKSALAVAIGHELLRSGIHVNYVDLNHVDDEKPVVTAILSAVSGKAESPDLQQLHRWAGRLRARRVLILDNCDSLLDFDDENRKNRFLTFLSKLARYSSRLSLLMTSRYQFTILDLIVETLEIGPLSEDASHTLLQSMYGQLSRANSSSLAKLTGHNALALKVTGALLKEGTPLSDLMKELRSNPIQTLSPNDFRPEEQVRACISSSFVRLSKSQKVALVTLAYIPGTFDESDAATILNATNSTVHGSLPRQLRRRCLLEYDEKSKKYHLHSLILAYAKEKSTIYTKPLMVEKDIVRCYFRKLMDIVVHYEEAPLVALKRFDFDQQNFYHLFTMLIYPTPGIFKGGTINSESISILASMSAGLVDARMSLSRRIRWYRTAVSRSEMVLYLQSDVSQEHMARYCHLFHLLIKSLARRGDMASAIKEVTQQEKHVVGCDEKYRVNILMTLCLSDSATGDLTEENLECHRSMSEPLSIPSIKSIKSFLSLAEFYYLEGHVSEAYNCYKSAEADGNTRNDDSEFDNPLEWTKQTRSMLETYAHKRKEEEFVIKWRKWFSSSYELMLRKFRVSPETAEELFRLGRALYKVSNEDALLLLLQSQKIQMQVFRDDHTLTLRTFQLIGHIYFAAHNYTLAVDYYNRSLSMNQRIHGLHKTELLQLLNDLGDALNALQLDDAAKYWKQALEILKKSEFNRDFIILSLKVARWHEDRLELYTAYGYFAQAYRAANSIDCKDESILKSTETGIPTSSSTELETVDRMLSTRTLISLLVIVLNPIFDPTGMMDDSAKLQTEPDITQVVDFAYYSYYMFLFTKLSSIILTELLIMCLVLRICFPEIFMYFCLVFIHNNI